MTDKPPAPHGLDLVMDFVNTADLETGKDALGEPSDLATWLTTHGLLPARTKLGAEDLGAARELREALRRTMLANNGGRDEGTDERLLEGFAARGQLGVRFDHRTARLTPRAGGLPGALAALLVPVAESMSDGSWQRAKACRADDCHWAFYDFSRNRSGTWCEMAVCGNREKVRSYRQRGVSSQKRA